MGRGVALTTHNHLPSVACCGANLTFTTIHTKIIFMLIHLTVYLPPSDIQILLAALLLLQKGVTVFDITSLRLKADIYSPQHYATNRQVASSIPDGVIGILQ